MIEKYRPRLGKAEAELRPIGVGTSVGHGEKERLGVLEVEVLISELLSVDRFSTTAITHGEITSLSLN